MESVSCNAPSLTQFFGVQPFIFEIGTHHLFVNDIFDNFSNPTFESLFQTFNDICQAPCVQQRQFISTLFHIYLYFIVFLFDIRVITLPFKFNVITETFGKHCIHTEYFSFILLSISTSNSCLADAPTSVSTFNQFLEKRPHHTHYNGVPCKFHHLSVGKTTFRNLCDIIFLDTHQHKSFPTT